MRLSASKRRMLSRREFVRRTSCGMAVTMLLQSCGQAQDRTAGPGATATSAAAQPITAQASVEATTIVAAPITTTQVDTTAPPAARTAGATVVAGPEVSLEVKIGQMLMVGFRGLEATAELPVVREIRDYHLG